MSISKLKAELKKMQSFDSQAAYELAKLRWNEAPYPCWDYFVRGVNHEHSKSAHIASLLLEAIECLEFYADTDNWFRNSNLPNFRLITQDDIHDNHGGKKARELLTKLTKESE